MLLLIIIANTQHTVNINHCILADALTFLPIFLSSLIFLAFSDLSVAKLVDSNFSLTCNHHQSLNTLITTVYVYITLLPTSLYYQSVLAVCTSSIYITLLPTSLYYQSVLAIELLQSLIYTPGTFVTHTITYINTNSTFCIC